MLAAALSLPPSPAPAADPATELTILAPADTAPSRIAAEMAPDFTAWIKARRDAQIAVRVDTLPIADLFEAMADRLYAKSGAHTLLLIDHAWLDALAAPKWIVPLNQAIAGDKALDPDWYAPAIRARFQAFPESSANRWTLPQSGDALLLFLRRDWLDAAAPDEIFAAKHAGTPPIDLQALDLHSLDWPAARRLFAGFNRPDQGRWGLASAWAPRLGAVVAPATNLMAGHGGALWRPRDGQVEGVLNTQTNAAALDAWKALLALQPPDALTFDTDAVTDAFVSGRVFAAVQWASHGAAMTPASLRDQVAVVPPPSVAPDLPCSMIGGQSWALNAFAGEPQAKLAVEFLHWWHLPETALAFARAGGNPCDAATLSRDDFDALQPWFGAYRAALPRAAALWRDPRYPELLALHAGALAAFASDPAAVATAMLDETACHEQALLFKEGTAERQPEGPCAIAR